MGKRQCLHTERFIENIQLEIMKWCVRFMKR